MLWAIKSTLSGIVKKVIFLIIYIYMIIFCENKNYIMVFKNYLENEKIKIPEQLVVFGGLFLYSFIIERINFAFNILPKIKVNFILNKRHKVISCQYNDGERTTNTKKVMINYEKNFDNLFGKIILFFFKKYYFFILEISYPKAINLDMEFLDKSCGYETRKKDFNFSEKLINLHYIHIKDVFTYYININEIGDFAEYENEYKCMITTKGKFFHSKIKSNLDLYSKNKFAKCCYPLAFLFFFIFMNFKGLNIGVTSEGGE